ncbi:MAG TPA: diacylglycerol kinase family protein [Polyangiaceae bacterium]
MKPLLLVNPKAGGGKTGRMASEIRRVVEREIGEVDVVFTEHRGNAAEIAERAAREGRELVIAVGGDGTFSEAAHGVLRAGGKTRLGIIGQGTGGDFRKTLGLEHRLDRYVAAIASGHERVVDAGKARFRNRDGKEEERWFVNILSAGMGGLVDSYVASGSRALGGTAAYFLASTKALLRVVRGHLRCTIDGKPEALASYMIAICNGRYFGSGMHVAPMALVDDGKLEVVSMDAPSKLAFAAFSRKIYDGSHLRAPGVRHFTCEKIEIDLENEDARDTFLLDVDGEPLGGLPLSAEIAPRALTLRI